MPSPVEAEIIGDMSDTDLATLLWKALDCAQSMTSSQPRLADINHKVALAKRVLTEAAMRELTAQAWAEGFKRAGGHSDDDPRQEG